MCCAALQKMESSKRHVFEVLAFAIVVFVGTCDVLADVSANLIPNPGFELGADKTGLPLNWAFISYSPYIRMKLTSDQSHSGSFSWQGTHDTTGGSESCCSKFIPMDGASTYLLSVWLKSLNGHESIYFGWQQFNANYENLGIDWVLLNNQNAPVTWTQFSDLRVTQAATAYVKIIFYAPYCSIGTVWVDDVNLIKLDRQLLPPVGIANTNAIKTMDFGQPDDRNNPSHIEYSADVMDAPVLEGAITYRRLLPYQTVDINFPAFNIDANGFPLTPMLLEIHYKDTIDEHPSTTYRAFVSSRIDYLNPDPLFKGFSDKEYFCIAPLGGAADNQWKYMQFAFQKDAFQLLRAIDGRFTIRIEMPPGRACFLPINYVTLATITQSQYLAYAQKQRLLNGFVPASLPADYPASQPNYGNLTIFTRDSMQPVYKFTKPSAGEIGTTISAFSAQGEIEPLNFAIYSENGISGLTFDITDLTHQQGYDTISKSCISSFHIVYDEKRTTPYWGTLKKRYTLVPDRLEELSTLAIASQTSERLWFKVNIPADTQPGIYNGHIFIKQNGVTLQTVTVTLEVLPIKLDMPENLNPLWHDPYTQVFCSDSNEVFKLFRETGFDVWFNFYNPHLWPIVSGGLITGFNSLLFETVLDKMKDEKVVKDIVVIETEKTWREIYRTIFGKSAEESLSNDPTLYYNLSDPRFVSAFTMAIRKYEQIALQHNLSFIYSVVDEPVNYPYKRIIADRLYSILKDNGVLTTVTYENCDTAISPGSFLLPKNNGYDGNIPPLTEKIDYKIWTGTELGKGFKTSPAGYGYYAGTSHLRYPIYNRFTHGLFAFKTDAKIVATYALGHMVGDVFNDFDADPLYTYPDTRPDLILAYPTWSGKLLPTMSVEGIREGIKDAKYIATLKRLITERRNLPVSIKASNYLAEIKRRIDPNYYEDYVQKSDDSGFYKKILAVLSDSNNPDDFKSFSQIRQTIANYIIQLSSYPRVLPGDLNGDKKVDYFDLVIFTSQWLQIGCNNPEWCGFADLDHSGDVDFVDFAVFASNWLWLQ
jgi:hypothetical protein